MILNKILRVIIPKIIVLAYSLLSLRSFSISYFRRAVIFKSTAFQPQRMAAFKSSAIAPSDSLMPSPVAFDDELVKGCIYLLPFPVKENSFTFFTELDSSVKSLKFISPEENDAFCKKHKVAPGISPVCSLVLERSIFHPQGGGQASDSGVIELTVPVVTSPLYFQVIFVQKGISGLIDHYGYFRDMEDPSLIETIVPLTDIPARLKLDAEKRLLHTRIHSAGHALDAAVERCAGNYGLKMVPAKGYHFTDGPYVEYQLVEGDGGVMEPSEQLLKAFVSVLNDSLKALIQEDIPTEITIEASEGYDGFTRTVNLAGVSCPCGG